MWYKIQETLAIIFLIAVVVFITWASEDAGARGIVVFVALMLQTINYNKDFTSNNPNIRSYGWGYFIGWLGIYTALINILVVILNGGFYFGWIGFIGNMLFSLGGSTRVHSSVLIYFLSVLIYSYLMVKRTKSGWLTGSILWLNPLVWIINTYYGKNRWSEFDSGFSFKRGFIRGLRWFYGLKTQTKSLLLIPIFWILLVLSVINTFDIYGSIISNEEFWKIVKIILVPMLTVLLGFYMYKIITSNSR